MASSQGNTVTKPSTRRKRKIEIKKVEQSNKRYVTFSKRKQGLFNKVTELSILCQAETALILSSQNGKLYACGNPGPDAVIRRFLAEESPQQRGRAGKKAQQESVETLRLQHEAIVKQLKQEKKHLIEMKEEHVKKGCFNFHPWWNESIENMGLEDLGNFMASLEQLKLNLAATADGNRFSSLSHITPLPVVPPPPTFPNLSLSNGCFSEGQSCHWTNNGGGGSSNSMLPKLGFGPYYMAN